MSVRSMSKELSNKTKMVILQKIIREGINDRSSAVLAAEIGISKEHLSRIMKKGNVIPPSQRIINALASCLPNTNKEELHSLFGIQQGRENRTVAELIADSYNELRNNIQNILSEKRSYATVQEFVELVSICSSEQVKVLNYNQKIQRQNTLELWGLEYTFESCQIQFMIGVESYRLPYEFEETPMFISKVSFDGTYLEEKGLTINSKFKTPYAYKLKKFGEQGEEQSSGLVKVVYGFGFYLNELDEEKVERFFAEFKKEPKELEDKILGEQIAIILSKRTRLNFEYIEGENAAGVILTHKDVTDMERAVVEKYARALGLKKYGSIHFIQNVELKEDQLYDTLDL